MDLLGSRDAVGTPWQDVLRWVAVLRGDPQYWAEARVEPAEIESDRWVPIAARGYADMVVVSGVTGRVFAAEKSCPSLRLLAPSVSAWLEAYAADVERGAFAVEEGFGQAYLSRKSER